MIGLSIDEFWSLTPYEFMIVAEAHSERMKYEQNARIHQAYWIAGLVWQKRLPRLDKLLVGASKPKTYTDDEVAEMKQIHEGVIQRMQERENSG